MLARSCLQHPCSAATGKLKALVSSLETTLTTDFAFLHYLRGLSNRFARALGLQVHWISPQYSIAHRAGPAGFFSDSALHLRRFLRLLRLADHLLDFGRCSQLILQRPWELSTAMTSTSQRYAFTGTFAFSVSILPQTAATFLAEGSRFPVSIISAVLSTCLTFHYRGWTAFWKCFL